MAALFLFALECQRPRPVNGQAQVVGFFPGLGSRNAYQDLDQTVLDSGKPGVIEIYEAGAAALGFPGQPEKILLNPKNIPSSQTARQGFIGAAFLVHNLALEVFIRATADEAREPFRFVAYTGESFGIIGAAVASGSLSVTDGVLIAQAFTPLSLIATEGVDPEDPVAREMANYLETTGPLVREPVNVIALCGDSDDLDRALSTVTSADVEVHKLYSARQRNLYVCPSAMAAFYKAMAAFPTISVKVLKPPTTFTAHSSRMAPVREALTRFISKNGIVFCQPEIPVVSNNNAAILTTAQGVREAVLATTNEVMTSQLTIETLDLLRPDLIIKIGLGHKSIRLLEANGVQTPLASCTGNPQNTDDLIGALQLSNQIVDQLARLKSGEPFASHHIDLLRTLFQDILTNPIAERYLANKIKCIIDHQIRHPSIPPPSGLTRFLEIYQYTYAHQSSIDIAGGELVLRARQKKRNSGPPESIGHARDELQVLDDSGGSAPHLLASTSRAEAVVVHFSWPANTGPSELARQTRRLFGSQPLARQIYDQVQNSEDLSIAPLMYLYTLFQILRLQRPAIFSQNDYCFTGTGVIGWLVALSSAESLTFCEATQLYRAHLSGEAQRQMATQLSDSVVPVIAFDGTPLRHHKDLENATAASLHRRSWHSPIPIKLNGNLQILSVGSELKADQLDIKPFLADIVSILSAHDISKEGQNPLLDAVEDRSMLQMTGENRLILGYALRRQLRSSSISVYARHNETVIGFGEGGSESMTMFVHKDGQEQTVVRKVLTEALTTARWDPNGKETMLPPYTKARKQFDYIRALPDSIKSYFPKVYDFEEREVPIPLHQINGSKSTHREMSYEMSYVRGEEVSQHIAKHSPPVVVIARLYEEIFRLLHEKVHTVNRIPAPGETLEVSYFRKIEDRLKLCRKMAPKTFGPVEGPRLWYQAVLEDF